MNVNNFYFITLSFHRDLNESEEKQMYIKVKFNQIIHQLLLFYLNTKRPEKGGKFTQYRESQKNWTLKISLSYY